MRSQFKTTLIKIWQRLRFTLTLFAIAYIATPVALFLLCIAAIFGSCNPVGALLGGLLFPIPILGPFTNLFSEILLQRPVSSYSYSVWVSCLLGIILLPFIMAHIIKPNKTNKCITFISCFSWFFGIFCCSVYLLSLIDFIFYLPGNRYSYSKETVNWSSTEQ